MTRQLSDMATTPKIAIIGAGPGGLTLARLLQINNIDFTLYEASSSFATRSQGGTLDLHPRAGQRALKGAGLYDEFLQYARPEADKDKLVQFDGCILWDENVLHEEYLGYYERDGREEKPEIDRGALLKILLESVEPRHIQWGKKVVKVERASGVGSKIETTTVYFEDGTKEEDIGLLVGADGAWSKVRSLLTDVRPHYSGITAVELWAQNVSQAHEFLSEYVGEGSCYMFDEGRAIMAQRTGDGSIRVYACVRQAETWKDSCGIDWSDTKSACETLVARYFDDCSPDLQQTILGTRDALVVRPLYMLPVGMTWPHSPGVTLLGDAAHLMTPFGGVGVNVAMTDALVLANALIEKKNELSSETGNNRQTIDAAIKEYEEFMFNNGRENAEKTAHGLKNHFSADGGKERADKYKEPLQRSRGKDWTNDADG